MKSEENNKGVTFDEMLVTIGVDEGVIENGVHYRHS